MMLALQNKRFLVFGGAAVVFLLLLLGGLMVSGKQTVSTLAQRNAIEQRRRELETAVQGADPAKLGQENNALETELSEIERSLPEAEYMPTLIRQIESTAALTGNDIIELRPGEIRPGRLTAAGQEAPNPEEAKTKGGGEQKSGEGAAGQGGAAAEEGSTSQRYDEMDIELRFDGSYTGAFDFIKALGKLGKIISVETVEIEKAGPQDFRPGGRAAATVRLQAKAYILAPRSGFPGELSIRVY
jgi:Tfp pilus assembly protein PilO